MNLQKINLCISAYKERMHDPDYTGQHLWELVYQFQENWDIDSADFGTMYYNCFTTNSPFWHHEAYHPRDAMKRYISMNDDLVRSMFKDLFNEQKEITGRISRFLYQCDEFYKLDRQISQKVIPHDHGDMRMIFLYLAFRFPDIYSIFDFPIFRKFMIRIGSTQVPEAEDIDRFIKVCRTLCMLVKKDEELMELVNTKLTPVSSGVIYPMLIVYELYSL